MAVTSIWPIKGRVDRVINYTRNPEKVTEHGLDELSALHSIDGVLDYAANEVKTEHRSYVTCLNCREDTAAAQFVETKRLWGKTGGRVCYHGYQSFKADEVTAEMAHEIGVKLARELWGNRFEVLVATHCNTGHYHNHFVINSVSFADGYKFHNSHADYARMREASDRLCREYRLSVIEKPKGKSKHYAERLAEQRGEPTHRGTIREDIDRAILASTTERDFIRVMTEMGYEFKTRGKGGEPLKYPALKPPDAPGFFRFYKLGEDYSLEEIRGRILRNTQKKNPFPVAKPKPAGQYRCKGQFKKVKKVGGLRGLYFRYCYELHIIVKHPASVKRVSFLLREDITKLDRLDAETRLLGRRHINTIGELREYKKKLSGEMSVLTERRRDLRNEIKRLDRQGDTTAAEAVKAEISRISRELAALRKEVKLCDGIEERSIKAKEKLDMLLEQKASERKEMNNHELFGRRGRAGNEDIPGRY